MNYRVSFYRKNEVVDGRAPRYMQDIDVDLDTLDSSLSILDAIKKMRREETPGVIIRSVYKTPENLAIRKKPSYVFMSSSARNKWYSNHKSSQRERICHTCKKNEVEHYKRICKDCRDKRGTETATKKLCVLCQKEIPVSSRSRYCDTCAAQRKESQEKLHREKRAKQTTIDRIREQIAWAEDKLLTTTLKNCKLSSRFQGLRVPHVVDRVVMKIKAPITGKVSGIHIPVKSIVSIHDVATTITTADGDAREVRVGRPVLNGVLTAWHVRPASTVKEGDDLFSIKTDNYNRCRTCLQKFIDVQTVYLSNLMAEEQESEAFIASLLEPERALGAVAGV